MGRQQPLSLILLVRLSCLRVMQGFIRHWSSLQQQACVLLALYFMPQPQQEL